MTDIDITVDDENTETHEETTPDFAHAAIVAGAVAGVAVIGYVGVRFVKRQIVKRVMKKVLDGSHMLRPSIASQELRGL